MTTQGHATYGGNKVYADAKDVRFSRNMSSEQNAMLRLFEIVAELELSK